MSETGGALGTFLVRICEYLTFRPRLLLRRCFSGKINNAATLLVKSAFEKVANPESKSLRQQPEGKSSFFLLHLRLPPTSVYPLSLAREIESTRQRCRPPLNLRFFHFCRSAAGRKVRRGPDRPVNHGLSSPRRLHGVGEKIAPLSRKLMY